MISVIIPLYNSARFIGETLASVQSQTYSDWECIVVDDGSTDNGADIVRCMASSDGRIQYVYQDNAGPSAARNHGLRLAKGEYIQFLDADDWFPAHRFAIMLEAYQHTEGNVVLFSDLCLGAEQDIHLTSPYARKTHVTDIGFDGMYAGFGQEFAFIPGAILFPRQALTKVHWDEAMRASEDWDYYLQICRQGYVFRNVPETLFTYRMVNGSLSGNAGKVYRANYSILNRYYTMAMFPKALHHVTGIVYANLLQIKHRRMKRLILPKFSLWSFVCMLLMPFSLIVYYLRLKHG